MPRSYAAIVVGTFAGLGWLATRGLHDPTWRALHIVVIATIAFAGAFSVALQTSHPWRNFIIGAAWGGGLCGAGLLVEGIEAFAPAVALIVFVLYRRAYPQRLPTSAEQASHERMRQVISGGLRSYENMVDFVRYVSDEVSAAESRLERLGATNEDAWQALERIREQNAQLLRQFESFNLLRDPVGVASAREELLGSIRAISDALERYWQKFD